MISIIIPAYNAEKTIQHTIKSVLAQTYTKTEIIVINDGSTDHTLKVLAPFAQHIQLINIPNSGVSTARTIGLKHAKGTFIQYLDADDLLIPTKLALQVNALIENDADVAYGDWQKFINEGHQEKIVETIIRQINDPIEMSLFGDFWCPPAAILYSRRITEKIIWRKNLPIIQDARYLLDASLANGKFIYTKGIMALYRTAQSQSLSQKSDINFVKDLFENTKDIYQIWEKDFTDRPDKKQAIMQSLRHCINRLTVLDKDLARQAIQLLLTIAPDYLPPEKGLLRALAKIIGYRNAEIIAGMKRKFHL